MLKQIINQEETPESDDNHVIEDFGSKPARPELPPFIGSYGRSSSPLTGNKNILSSDVEIKGKLKFSNDLIVDGRIEGEVNSEGDLVVGENATIQGNINTRTVVVYGKVHGNISVTDRCELKQSSELHGDVSAGRLAIEEGATFLGSSAVGASRPNASGGYSSPVEDSPQDSHDEHSGE